MLACLQSPSAPRGTPTIQVDYVIDTPPPSVPCHHLGLVVSSVISLIPLILNYHVVHDHSKLSLCTKRYSCSKTTIANRACKTPNAFSTSFLTASCAAVKWTSLFPCGFVVFAQLEFEGSVGVGVFAQTLKLWFGGLSGALLELLLRDHKCEVRL